MGGRGCKSVGRGELDPGLAFLGLVTQAGRRCRVCAREDEVTGVCLRLATEGQRLGHDWSGKGRGLRHARSGMLLSGLPGSQEAVRRPYGLRIPVLGMQMGVPLVLVEDTVAGMNADMAVVQGPEGRSRRTGSHFGSSRETAVKALASLHRLKGL